MPLLALCFVFLLAGDWPQFLGPTRNGVSLETVNWPPTILWHKDAGEGFAAPVVANGKVVFFYRQNGKEIVDCLDANTGAKIWSYDYPTNYRDDFGFDEGPRSAPAIADGAVFTFGAQGVLSAVDFASGKKRWSVNTGAKKGWFGAASAPLIDGGNVLVNIGGIVAYDVKTGNVVWKATNDEASYSSPTVATINGAHHAFFLTRAGLVDLDPSNGQVRFSYPFRSRSSASVNAATPLVAGNQVFISASYGTGAALLEVNGSEYKKSGPTTIRCRIITRPACFATGFYTASTAARKKGRPCVACSCELEKSCGASTAMARARSPWRGTNC
jgi:outer membrane protein assembly factor BamB